ncbi:predicted protein [Histoplasma mississippiense (nom. inval.)]|uniref:predicted protein n=1 Tax=Ajellomyces capsulatus (strain NAm1 / WU24) TaxID=2059318 RepID=UPI000157B5F5|nr:predicted protein [Histoplasma mississippiense (nom. inval.)]EDN02639.1 predicted protein [Histoplasma mississippiense (nom. inval.)]
MGKAGFVNIKIQRFKIPIGPWSEGNKLKQLGIFALQDILEGLEAFSLHVFTQGLQWSMDELQKIPNVFSKLWVYWQMKQKSL